MESFELTERSPSRIPRPTFMASSPRTPSIRAVPYSHMDRVATDTRSTGTYSPTNWPFPQSTESQSLDAPVATTHQDQHEHRDEHRDEGGTASGSNLNRTGSVRSEYRARDSVGSTRTMTEALFRRLNKNPRGHTDSIASVETQIYSPIQGESSTSANRYSRPISGRISLPGEVTERPPTPTPYSILRKVSEVSEPDSDAEDDQESSGESQHQETARPASAQIRTPQGSTAHGRPSKVASVRGSIKSVNTAHAATPDLRDDEGRVMSLLYPCSRASVGTLGVEPQQQTRFSIAGASVQADYGGSDAGITSSAREGAIIVTPSDVMDTVPRARAVTRISSLFSRRRTTLLSEAIPDLESLHLGPRLRHNRLPESPSMAVNAGRPIPESTKQLWGGLGQFRKMMLASGIVLGVSIINIVASVSAVIVTYVDHGSAATGLVAWAVVSGVFVLASGGLLLGAFLQYRNTNKELVDGETWIEMHLRSRPLPPRPKSGQRKRNDNGATVAWYKFSQDHEQLRRYVEFLEGRVSTLEEGRQNADQQDDAPKIGATVVGNTASSSSNTQNRRISSSGIRNFSRLSRDTTPKDKGKGKEVESSGASLSRRQLLQPEDSVTEPESWRGSDHGGGGGIPQSDTKASILTELCEAVTATEGYSPLAEPMPQAHIPRTLSVETPSPRPRANNNNDNNGRHLAVPARAVIHQLGAFSADLPSRRLEDI